MFCGIIMDTIRDGILRSYGAIMWKRIVNEVKLPSETFDFYLRYDDHLLINICDSMAEILNDGTRDTYLEFFGVNFIHYFYRYGFDKILRVVGRTFGNFLYATDQLHDSNRFTFPQMQHPLFHVIEENEKCIGQIHLSQAAYSHLMAGKRFTIEHRGQVDIKGKGSIDTYWLTGSNEKFSTTTINKSTISLRCPFSGHGWTVK